MSFESVTDSTIIELIGCAKILANPKSKSKEKEGHRQASYDVYSKDSKYKFEVYKRQNLRVGMEDDFSCGISWIATSGELLTLRRYNGPSHKHLNQIEKDKLEYVCHIHEATEKYIISNKKPEGFAQITDRFNTLEGAFHCLITDCNIEGIETFPDDFNQFRMFE